MDARAAAVKTARRSASHDSLSWPKWRGLQARMTLSYVWMTLFFGLLIAMLALALLVMLINSKGEQADLSLGQKTVVQYAYAASLQSDGLSLNPHSTFQPGQAYTLLPPGSSRPGEDVRRTFFLDNLVVPYVADADSHLTPDQIALLIAPGGQVVASSYPARYPTGTVFSALFPHQAALVAQALRGTSMYAKTPQELFSFTATVWGSHGGPIGAVYLQGQGMLIGGPELLDFLRYDWTLVLGIVVLVLLIATPVGGLFGLLTTRGLVRRIRRLVGVTNAFASSDYVRRVPVSGKDEIGQLEHHFNQMADRLVEGLAQRQAIAEENARLAERARISRELHDAIAQDLFSLRMQAYGLRSTAPTDAEVQAQLATLEGTTSRMISEMRALLLELRPARLEQVNLVEALNDLAASYSGRVGVSVTVETTPVELQPETEHALLRIAQEGLSNAVRHAHASEISVRLSSAKEEVCLTIRDNGAGFASDASLNGHGFGLSSMRERVDDLGGTFALRTAPDLGTEIRIHIPLKGGVT